ncbi:methyltransferase domain-containing protein [Halomonas sp. PAMB 3232]|uniref:putative RNA methyltransferase n=1 Tax=Halomonas sp. PAMB 3232 TaxID=3075221 RepID=UPI002899607E|nr:methyltransferase domain-containing protein [Halomonas sp. PAMB 3232]WNL38237.1 methyltransferase domain-containing protein [Halomonas sp. PAMB 3232]
MSTTPFQSLACPLDGQPLSLISGAWRCAAGHSFDIAKQGHVNLLPVQQKRSVDPGDSKVMVAARQRFLGAGHYQVIADAVSAAALEGASENEPLACLDAGCGEGYYLRRLAQASDGALSLMGLDISKWAVLAAARQSRPPSPVLDIRWAVGSNASLPVQSQTLDRLLCMFGFPVASEFERVLKPGGVWLQVEAGPEHLRELREIIYPRLKAPRADDTPTPDGFELADTRHVSERFTLESAGEIADLLTMTPHLYRASSEGRERAQALETLTLTIDVVIKRWVRA